MKSSRWYWIVAFLIFLAGVVDFSVFLIKGLGQLSTSLIEVAVPGTYDLTLSEPGTYTVFKEIKQDEPLAATISVRIISKTTGAFVPLNRSSTTYTYSWNGRAGISSLEFQIQQPGPYELSCSYSGDRSGRTGTLAIGHNWGDRSANILRTGATGFLAWVAVGSVIAAIPFVRRQAGPAPPRAVAPAAAVEAGTEQTAVHRLRFYGTGAELFGIFVFNVLFTILTLGLYSFWAKVRTRRYLWGQTEFAGDRFGFHGTGRELLLGWLKAGLLFGGLVGVVNVLPLAWDHPLVQIAATLLFWTGLLVLIPLAIVGTMRYRLSRTSWRGIRFTFRGHYPALLRLFIRGMLLSAVSFGLYYPFYQTELRRFLTEHSFFGSTPFKFDGDGGDFFGRFVLALLLTLPTFGLIWIWYAAFQRRYYWDHTTFAGARFHCTVTAGGLLGLYAGNLALILISLGLALPWATVRTRRYDLDHLVLKGPVDLDSIAQQAQAATPTGEELAGFLDVDALPG